ncbi:hypothetical protein BEP19_05550 [Ammoniphilus oxalaticus]|uniref:Fimbrial assembly protein n=1 Tax=Ammoniphilus oxalaticus TaxID=66863 RepID=A0A419SIW3_9BACL|nr:hypothetical protein [Ammoniphilus oxalaticus]RKD23892.1 hypothetical protein BEP19_05550 [Ammoniphilus oxalaticus]
MEINLIPKEPFVVKHFKQLLLLICFILLLMSISITQYILQQEKILAHAEERVIALKKEKSLLEQDIAYNRGVLEREEELKEYRKYKALIEGIEANRGPSWAFVLEEVSTALPDHAVLLELEGEGNRVLGTAAVYNLTDAAYFLDQIENLDTIESSYMRIIQESEVYEDYHVDPRQAKIVEFTLYTKGARGDD